MNRSDMILETLKREVVPAMGCTEPVAVALACAKAKELKYGVIEDISVKVSPNIYKNGLAVGIPHTEEVGLFIAAALGIIAGDSEKNLEVLSEIEDREVDSAKALLKSGKLSLDIADTDEKIYIEVVYKTNGGSSKVIIQGKHNNFTYIDVDGKALVDDRVESSTTNSSKNLLYTLPIREIIQVVESMSGNDLEFMLDGFEMNERIAKKGLESKLGMGVGYGLQANIEKGILSDDLHNIAMVLTAAASDARMSGTTLPVMSSNGSGNNGLTAILPLVAYSKKIEVDDERMAKSLAISHLINSYIKNYIGRLSAICGCGVAAGTGAGAALAWLMGASYDQIDGVINNMLANTSGMVCDGAKVGCALKLATSASAAVQSALLALEGSIVPMHNGIVGETVEETIRNLGIVSDKGMRITDSVILQVMREMQ
jgi:L-cysteine desulfidase